MKEKQAITSDLPWIKKELHLRSIWISVDDENVCISLSSGISALPLVVTIIPALWKYSDKGK